MIPAPPVKSTNGGIPLDMVGLTIQANRRPTLNKRGSDITLDTQLRRQDRNLHNESADFTSDSLPVETPNDVLALKIKVAELETELQAQQVRVSRYQTLLNQIHGECVNIQKENEMIKKSYELLMKASDVSKDQLNLVKKENKELKKVMKTMFSAKRNQSESMSMVTLGSDELMMFDSKSSLSSQDLQELGQSNGTGENKTKPKAEIMEIGHSSGGSILLNFHQDDRSKSNIKRANSLDGATNMIKKMANNYYIDAAISNSNNIYYRPKGDVKRTVAKTADSRRSSTTTIITNNKSGQHKSKSSSIPDASGLDNRDNAVPRYSLWTIGDDDDTFALDKEAEENELREQFLQERKLQEQRVQEQKMKEQMTREKILHMQRAQEQMIQEQKQRQQRENVSRRREKKKHQIKHQELNPANAHPFTAETRLTHVSKFVRNMSWNLANSINSLSYYKTTDITEPTIEDLGMSCLSDLVESVHSNSRECGKVANHIGQMKLLRDFGEMKSFDV